MEDKEKWGLLLLLIIIIIIIVRFIISFEFKSIVAFLCTLYYYVCIV